MADTLTVTLTSAVSTGGVSQLGPPVAMTDGNVNARLLDKIQIPAGSVDFAISMDSIVGRYVILKFNGDVSVKLNGTGSTAIALDAAATNPAMLMILGGAITSIHVSNAGATAVECERLLASN